MANRFNPTGEQPKLYAVSVFVRGPEGDELVALIENLTYGQAVAEAESWEGLDDNDRPYETDIFLME